MKNSASAALPKPTREERPDWTCEACGHEHRAFEVPWVGGNTRLKFPPPIGDCDNCRRIAREQAAEDSKRREAERIIRPFMAWAHPGDEYKGATFEQYEVRPGTEEALAEAKRYVEHFSRPGGDWLLFYGVPGNGKTKLGNCIRNAIWERYGVVALSVTQPYWHKELEAARRRRHEDWRPGDHSEEWINDHLAKADFLLLDDLMPWDPKETATMFNLIDTRLRMGMKTVFTTNLTPELLKKQLDSRVWDRMMGRTNMLPVTATSYRVDVERKRL